MVGNTGIRGRSSVVSKIHPVVMGALMTSVAIISNAAESKMELTVYNSNLGLVRERRTLELPRGKGEVKFTDVASQIDATSVLFKSVDDKNVVVLDQNYEYDLVSSDKLLQKYIDKNIQVITKGKGDMFDGTLLSCDGAQLVLKTSKGLAMVNRENIQDIRFEQLPEGLITKPTLNWLVDGGKGGPQTCEIAYLTGGIDWRCDYTVVVSDDDASFKDFGGWVTLNNQSGATYQDAKLKLIAGDVHRAERPRSVTRTGMTANLGYDRGMEKGGFEERAFFEYHLYSLGRLVTVKQNQIKQEELLTASNIPVKKCYEFDHTRSPKIAVKMEFRNDEQSHLGMPLPMGKVRVYKEDLIGKSLEFVGEDNLEHTPKDEKRRLMLGNAFDVVAERKQTDMKMLTDRVHRTTYEVKLRNHKEKGAVTIQVIDHAYGEWELLSQTVDGKPVQAEKKDARTMSWNIPVAPGPDGVTLTYTVEQRR